MARSLLFDLAHFISPHCEQIIIKEMICAFCMQVVIWREKRVIERDYATSLRWITEQVKKGFMYKHLSMFKAKYHRVLYFAFQSVFTFLSIVNSYFNYHW